MGHARTTLLPRWALAWYAFNIMILPFDAVYILLRPTGRVADVLMAPMHLYARYDPVFADPTDLTVYCIYLVGIADIVASAALLAVLTLRPRARSDLRVSIFAVAQSAEVATKTLVYLLYALPAMDRALRMPITILTAIWILIPLLLIAHVARAAAAVPLLDHRE